MLPVPVLLLPVLKLVLILMLVLGAAGVTAGSATGSPSCRRAKEMRERVCARNLRSPIQTGLNRGTPPPPPLYKLRPCPSYSRRRDRISLVPNFNSAPNVV